MDTGMGWEGKTVDLKEERYQIKKPETKVPII